MQVSFHFVSIKNSVFFVVFAIYGLLFTRKFTLISPWYKFCTIFFLFIKLHDNFFFSLSTFNVFAFISILLLLPLFFFLLLCVFFVACDRNREVKKNATIFIILARKRLAMI